MNITTLLQPVGLSMNRLRLALLLATLAFCFTGTPLQAADVAAANPASPLPVQAVSPQAGQEAWRAAMAAADPELEGLSDAEVMRLGEAMYRDGLLSSGEGMQAFIRGDIEVDSTSFSCSSCHQRAGLGSFEGGVVTPPTNGRLLYQPYRRPPSLNDKVDKMGHYNYAKTIQERPAYTRETLKSSLRYGQDPTGELFNDVMPRYPLATRDMAIMVRYLELLSRDYSPGANLEKFTFATIITDDVNPADRQALLVLLRRFAAAQNQQVDLYRDFLKFGYKPTGDMKFSFRNVALVIWDLKGPPQSWEAQLAAYAQRDQVFAVLGGISNQDWQPIHDFCEAQRLPCLYPITDLPVISGNNWYTLYFNKGFYQEGEATARFLNRREGIDAKTRILQLVEDSPAGRALAAGFDGARRDLNLPPVETLTLSPAQLHDSADLSAQIVQKDPQVLLLWSGPAVLPGLPDLTAALAGTAPVFVSSTALGQATATIPEALREQLFITFPYRLKPYYGD
ncbi:MAG: ABC transporter substrate-binding protein, partial [Desulfuromonadales bacterium]